MRARLGGDEGDDTDTVSNLDCARNERGQRLSGRRSEQGRCLGKRAAPAQFDVERVRPRAGIPEAVLVGAGNGVLADAELPGG